MPSERLEQRLNNAIYKLALHARGQVNARRFASINELARHWASFWQSEERRLTPTNVLYPKLIRYLRWYTRAWELVPPQVKQLVPSPDKIEPSAGQAMLETLRAYRQSQQDMNDAGGDALRDAWGFLWASGGKIGRRLDESADKLRSTIKTVYDAGQAMKIGVGVGAVFGAGLVLYLLFRRGSR